MAMQTVPPEDKLRQKRFKSEQAISLAIKSRWAEAAKLNREILDLFPNEVDALNRLGKSLTELGQYAEARDAYQKAVRLDSSNSIAAKNLGRLSKLVADGASVAPPSTVDPRLFIEESGKTVVTMLTDVHRGETLSRLAPGEKLQLGRKGKQIWVLDSQEQPIGRIEPKLESTLNRLLQLGNQYSVFVTAVHDLTVTVIVREAYRSAQMGDKPSFRPSVAPEGVRAWAREGLRLDDDDDDDDDEPTEEEEDDADAEPVVADPNAPEETSLQELAANEDPEEEK